MYYTYTVILNPSGQIKWVQSLIFSVNEADDHIIVNFKNSNDGSISGKH